MENLKNNARLLLLVGISTIPIVVTSIYFMQREKKKRQDLIKQAQKAYLNMEKTKAAEAADLLESNVGSQAPSTWTALGFEEPLVIAMVGLPARGKSYISKMLMRYLKWTGFECELFNVGSYRREMGFASADSNFFSAGNQDAHKVREELAMSVQECMYLWLKSSDGNKRRVAIFDATNTTISRRLALAKRARQEGVFLLFIEVNEINI